MADKIVKVAAALIIKDGRALLTRRKEGKFAGKWELPGGKLELGENAQQACVREIHEELGLSLTDLKEICLYEYQYPDFKLEMTVFAAPWPQGTEPHLQVHDAYACAGADELPNFAWLPADFALVPKLQHHLRTAI